MGKCLLTTLKAVVDNPDLPVLEVLEQFTLDAIAKSGNTAMTDAQKSALNTFFIKMGAVEESTLWGKVRTLFLPIIGVGKTTIVLDYKNDDAGLDPDNSYLVDQAGALEVSTDSDSSTPTISSTCPNVTAGLKNSAFLAVAAPGGELTGNIYISVKTGTIERTIYFTGNPAVIACVIDESGTTGTKRFSENALTAALANYKSDAMSGTGIKDGNSVATTATDYGNYGSISGSVTDAAYSVKMKRNVKYGILIDFNTALTDMEVSSVLEAATALRSAFVSS